MNKKCKCGCGKQVNNKFVRGHSSRTRIIPIEVGKKISIGVKKNWVDIRGQYLSKLCPICKKKIHLKPSHYNRRKYCSIKCKSISMVGKEPWNTGMKGFREKENSHLWKGGITPINQSIRSSLEYKNWRNKIFLRDDYTCQYCFNRGYKIHAHHKNQFSKLLNEFLKEYSQFSPIEDKETLIRLAITYKPFWDIENGITLCKKCHAKVPTDVLK